LLHQAPVLLAVHLMAMQNRQLAVPVMINLNHPPVVHRAEATKSNHSKKSRPVMFSGRDF